MYILEAVNMLLVVIGVILLAIPKISGLYVMVLAQCGWLTFALIESYWFFASQAVLLLIINAVAIKNWKKKGVGV